MDKFSWEYEIVATLGPASQGEATWEAMLSAGVSGFRLNTSHLTIEQLRSWLDRLHPFLSARDLRQPLVLDLQGSKWRLGQFAPFELQLSQRVELISAASSAQPDVLPVPHPDFFRAAPLSSAEIVLDDAKIRLKIESIRSSSLAARVTRAGAISPLKGITFASSEYRQETLPEKDQAILEQTQYLPAIRYALSYVKDAVEMARYRAMIGSSAYLIAKLERGPALVEAIEIADSADELWLCRGDLGAEMGLKAMAIAVQRFAELPGSLAIPVLLAGQVLEHMTGSATPTRSEVCYLFDALQRGYGGFVLSDETAIGCYPLESCRVAALFRK